MGYPQNIKVTVDAVVFAYHDKELQVLLIQRKNDPFQGKWAIPGGFVEDDEDLDTAAARELEEETAIKVEQIQQFYTFGKPDRDPRGRAISVSYYTQVDAKLVSPEAASDAAATQWFNMNELPELAFDHEKILDKAKVAFLNEVQ